ncbi:hypothetical protein NA78x_005397 [Anatilimnocola sp. NA78]|uniref:hypothetical protein n=1 Tax=Anatilimnocola sp. NA78 TaxID=3415683 RepID=UPI003CE4DF75
MKLTIRDFLWLMLVVGLVIALWRSRVSEDSLRQQLANQESLNLILEFALEEAGMPLSIRQLIGRNPRSQITSD